MSDKIPENRFSGVSDKIPENRFSGDMIEFGVLEALFGNYPASEVTAMSGAQGAFEAARFFLTQIVHNQCHLAGCALQYRPYGVGDVHTEKCWFGKRAQFYKDRASKDHESQG